MYAIIDVYNRGGPYSLGTIVELCERRPGLKKIRNTAIKRAGGKNSSGYIPCIGAKLVSKVGIFCVGQIVNEEHCLEIFGDESSLRSIQLEQMVFFDKENLIANAIELNPAGRPSTLNAGQRYNVYLDQNSVAAAKKIGTGNISEGIRIALEYYLSDQNL